MPTDRCGCYRIPRTCYANGIHTVCDTISAETCWLRGQTCKSMCMPIERECRAFGEGYLRSTLRHASYGIARTCGFNACCATTLQGGDSTNGSVQRVVKHGDGIGTCNLAKVLACELDGIGIRFCREVVASCCSSASLSIGRNATSSIEVSCGCTIRLNYFNGSISFIIN